MPVRAASDFLPVFMTVFWWTGWAVFYGRFYVQWIASEIKKRTVVPVAFWYMSAVGSVMLLTYNVYTRQPGAAFGQSFNMVVYARNLIHIWRERGKLSKALSVWIHSVTAVIVLSGVVFTALTWYWEYQANQTAPPRQAAMNWAFLGIWAAGQGLFFLRFLIQWIVTEAKKKSVIPPIFWHISIVASVMQGVSFAQRHDWLNTAGMAATLFIYARNAWMIHRNGPDRTGAAVG